MSYCSECGKKLLDGLKYCPYCGNPVVVPGMDKCDIVLQEKKNDTDNSTVSVHGFGNALFYSRMTSVKIFINEEKIGEVKHNEVTAVHIDSSCLLTFKYLFHSAECYVNGGEQVLLFHNNLTGALSAIVTDNKNLPKVINENNRKNKILRIIGAVLIGLLAGIAEIIKTGCYKEWFQ